MKSKFVLMFLAMVLTCGCGVGGGSGEGTDGSGGGGTGTGRGDATPPTILATAPCDCGESIPTDATLSVIFSEAVQPTTINFDTFRIRQNFSNISGTFSYSSSGAAATFWPSHPLTPFTTYTAEVRTGVTDTAGNVAELHKKWSFRTGGTPATVRFTDVQQIFNDKCTSCHKSGGQSAFLPLTYDVAYEKLMERPSTYTQNGTLVRNGYSAESVLYQRITGNGVTQMPLNAPSLDSTSQNVIKAWIDQGALNN